MFGIGTWLGKSILMQSPIGGLLARFWKPLAIGMLLIGAYLWHQHKMHQFKADVQRAQMAADNDHWKTKLAQAHRDALDWKTKYVASQTAIAEGERAHHEENVRNNAAVAAALSLSGPGAAASHCGPVNRPTAGAVSSGPGQTAPAVGAATPPMPAEDWATVPWRWLVNVVQQHDDLISEATATRNQHAREQELYQRSVVSQQQPR